MISLGPPHVFGLIARLGAEADPGALFLRTERLAAASSILAWLAAIIVAPLGASLEVALACSYTAGLAAWVALRRGWVVPGLLAVGQLAHAPSWPLSAVWRLPLAGYVYLVQFGSWGMWAYFSAVSAGYMLNNQLLDRAYAAWSRRWLGRAIHAPEASFFQAYSLAALTAGVSRNLELGQTEQASRAWERVLAVYAKQSPRSAHLTKEAWERERGG